MSGCRLQETDQERERRKAPFTPAYTKLVMLIQGRVRYPDNWDSLPGDAKREFLHSRDAVSDTLLDAACKNRSPPSNPPRSPFALDVDSQL